MKSAMKIFFSTTMLITSIGAFADAPDTSHIPAWWIDAGIITSAESELSSTTIEANYEVANLGQLMFISSIAKNELSAKYPGTTDATVALDALINGFIANNTINDNNPNFDIESNYYALNIGQLKYVASLFYNRLWELPTGSVIWPTGMTFLGGEGKYPWSDLPEPTASNYDAEIEKNYEVANIGQLKYLFSWRLNALNSEESDSDGDGIADSWEMKYFGNLTTANGTSCYNGDGKTDLQKYQDGEDPTLPPVNSGLFLFVYTPLEQNL
jgi:hypothetical protein